MTLRERLARRLLRGMGDQQASAFFASIFNSGPVSLSRLTSTQLLQSYSTMPWLRAVFEKLGMATASVEWKLYVAQKAGAAKAYRHYGLQRNTDPAVRRTKIASMMKAGELREITSHVALSFLYNGNKKFPGLVGWMLTQEYLDLIGEAVWILERNGLQRPTEWYPIPPTWLDELPSNSNGRKYVVSFPNTGPKSFDEKDVFYMYRPDPANPYNRGSGLGRTYGDELETDEYAAKHVKAWFKNRATPQVLITGSGLKSEEMDRIENRWLQKLQGTAGLGKPHFLSTDAKVTTISQSFKDMELSQLRKDQRDILIHTIGFPPEIFGILENSNRATITAAEYLFLKQVVLPRAELLRTWLQDRIIPEWDDRLILDYENIVPEDKTHRLDVMKAAPHAFDIDEWRQQADHENKVDGSGKVHYVPHTLAPVADLRLGAESPLPDDTSEEGEETDDDDEVDDDALNEDE